MSASIRCRGLSRRYDGRPAVEGAALEVPAGSFHALLGPSGCGKTTFLRLLAGFEVPDEGSVELGGDVVAGPGLWVPPEARRVGMVFQDPALFPHMSVRRNVAFGIRGGGDAVRKRVLEVLDLVGLLPLVDRLPAHLSGGERQRAALARALAPGPEVMLLDEPFSSLDARLREGMREEVRRILRTVGTTVLLVTHDRDEAMSLADRVSVMFEGRIHQTAVPDHVYRRPVDMEVAAFLGRATFLTGAADGASAATPFGVLPLVQPIQGPVTIMVRPEQVHLGRGTLRLAVVKRQYFGHDVLVALEGDGGLRLLARTGPETPAEPGTWVTAAVAGPVLAWPL